MDIERYVAGQLSADEAAQFEERLLEHPELIDQVEAVRQLRLGIRTLSKRGELSGIQGSRAASPVRWLMAAGLAAAVVGTLFVTLRTTPQDIMVASLQQLPEALRDQPLAGEYLLLRTRGNPVELATLSTPAPIAVNMQLGGIETGAHYTVGLVCDGKVLSTVEALATDGAVVVYLDASRLPPGTCEFQARHGGESESFPVRIVAHD